MAVTTEPTGFVGVLRNRNFLFLWIAQVLSQTSQNGINFVQLVLVTRLTHSAAHLGAMIIAFSLPAVLLSAVAGVVVDRVPKKSILTWSNVIRVVTTAGYILALHLLSGESLLFTIYTLTFIYSAVGQFFSPAEAATIPLLVGPSRLMPANSLFNLTFTGSQVVGLVFLAPFAVKLLDIDGTYVLLAVMFGGAAALVAALPRDASARASAPSSQGLSAVWTELREGVDYVLDHHELYMAVIQMTLVQTLLLVMAMLAPVFAERVLGLNAEDAILIFLPAGIGLLVASLLVGRFGRRFSRESLTNGSVVAMGVTLILLGAVGRWSGPLSIPLFSLRPDLIISVTAAVVALAFVLGLEIAIVSVPAQTALQECSTDVIRGRVYAVLFMVSNLAGILPLLFLGNLADQIGIPRVTALLGLAILSVGAWSIFHSQTVRRREAAM